MTVRFLPAVRLAALALAACTLTTSPAAAQRWLTAWMAPGTGPYPAGAGIPGADLSRALPTGSGAHDQTFRIVIKPEAWAGRVRLRFSNALGTKPVQIDGVFLGLHSGGATVMPQSNRPVLFAGKKAVTVAPGQVAWSDAVYLAYVGNPVAPELVGRKLVASFHVAGESGPITWHPVALQTSYLTPPGAGALGELEDESAFPHAAASAFLLDAFDVQAGPEVKGVVCLGDGLTDGVGSTPNGDDRWPDALARRLRAAGIRASVVNAGLAGSLVTGPAAPGPDAPPGSAPAPAPSALARLDRDVLGLSGVTHVIWQPSLAELGAAGRKDWEAVRDAMRLGTDRLRARLPGLRVIAATVPPPAAAAQGAPGTQALADPEVDRKRKALNQWIRDSGTVFDGVADFDAALRDPATGALRADFVTPTANGGDGLHPNRAGYLAVADAVDLRLIAAGPRPAPRGSAAVPQQARER